ncbi:MAG: amino acid permease [Bdellovibrionales bacterium CG12_big_fil_rev_8_21_14_0_65_38_15]|nr:MAG: amino acid permease [Bdellovibrionales bacterium CG22_combo_CG10-13_8_21_14_all_38_13]PIQ53352.1 MAG: amino acid permease [Bdellovibrionales bacterium CG12_big_fil_rev_8_21_14_0_65_38_15]PIR30284.1 MAG: amino acid permease [Bdellovibrionales bacterium CG11_big_fil_rev_8_21_14_0_20_38_13]
MMRVMSQSEGQLKRVLGVKDAVVMGLGSIMGTGAFVSLGIAAGVSGQYFFLSLFLAALLAGLNGLSTAQLASKYPVSGGAYEYARGEVSNFVGFLAGWLFLVAKSASASTAALGAVAAISSIFSLGLDRLQMGLYAAITVMVIGLFVCLGLKRSQIVNRLLVSIVLLALIVFGIVCLSSTPQPYVSLSPPLAPGLKEVFYGAALLFVSFTGYGRVATLGEEVINPKRTIPIAVVMSLVVVFGIYFWISICSIHVVGEIGFGELAMKNYAPLQSIARLLGYDWLRILLVFAALAAMLGVLLNLILGLSRVALAMSRHKDLPSIFDFVSSKGEPVKATMLITFVIMAFCLTEKLEKSWELSALTVLLYYSITNISALKLKTKERFLSSHYSALGLIGCLSLAFFVDSDSLLKGLAVIIIGSGYYYIRQKYFKKS